MKGWAIAEARERVSLDVYDPLRLGREAEPVEVTLHFGLVRPVAAGICGVDDEGRPVPSQIVAASAGEDGRLGFATLCFLADLPEGRLNRRYHAYLSEQALPAAPSGEGIVRLESQLEDGVRRLDTGTYVLELC